MDTPPPAAENAPPPADAAAAGAAAPPAAENKDQPAVTPAADIPRKSKKRARLLIGLFILGAMVLKSGFVFLCIGMLPAMVSYIIDHDKHKYIFSTIAAFNLAGVFPEMMNIYMQGGGFDTVKAELCDAFVWLTMYAAAGLGAALVWLSPKIATVVLQGVYSGRIAFMESNQRKLVDEWGEDVKRKVPSRS